VVLDRPLGHVERLGDLAVAHARRASDGKKKKGDFHFRSERDRRFRGSRMWGRSALGRRG